SLSPIIGALAYHSSGTTQAAFVVSDPTRSSLVGTFRAVSVSAFGPKSWVFPSSTPGACARGGAQSVVTPSLSDSHAPTRRHQEDTVDWFWPDRDRAGL